MAARLQVSLREWRGDAWAAVAARSATSALRRRIMLWLELLVLFSGRADGVAVLLSARLASSGSDANVCASGNQLYRAVWLWSDTRKLLDEFLAAGNILAYGRGTGDPAT